MGKAIYGAVGGPDPRLVAEVARLKARVAALEAEVGQLRGKDACHLCAHELELELLSSSDTALV